MQMGAALISQPGMVGHGGPPGAMGPQGLPPPPPQHYFDPRADVGHQHQLDSLRNRLRNPSTHRSHGGPQGRLPPRRWRGGPQNQPPPPHAHSQTQAAAASFNSVNPYPVITPLGMQTRFSEKKFEFNKSVAVQYSKYFAPEISHYFNNLIKWAYGLLLVIVDNSCFSFL